MVDPGRLPAERTSQPGLADSGLTGDQVVMGILHHPNVLP